jgi:hypothetical protein
MIQATPRRREAFTRSAAVSHPVAEASSQKALAMAALPEQTGNIRDDKGPGRASMMCSGMRDEALCTIHAGIFGDNTSTQVVSPLAEEL